MKYYIILTTLMTLLDMAVMTHASHVTSREGNSPANPYKFSIILEPEACQDEDLIVVIHSAASFFKRRQLMRDTWASKSYLEDRLRYKTKVIFVLGMADLAVMESVRREHNFHKDILLSSFIDSYRNNTYKAMSYMLWTSRNCASAKVLLKVDDDALIHPMKTSDLEFYLNLTSRNTYSYTGFEVVDSQVVPRDPKSQWFVTTDQWEDDFYPTWYQGLAYMISIPLVMKISLRAEDQPYLFVDDVFVGILISKVPAVSYHRAQDLSCHHLDLSSRSLIKHLYWRFYYERNIFYHVPNFDLFEQWWLCAVNENCEPPLITDLLTAVPTSCYLAALSLLCILYYRKRLNVILHACLRNKL